jgi:hypothetical protein
MKSNPRKIVFAPQLGYLVVVPANYDADKITRHDATHDLSIRRATQEVWALAEQSLLALRERVESAQGEERQALEERLDVLRTSWQDVLVGISSMDIMYAKSALGAAAAASVSPHAFRAMDLFLVAEWQ